ncbi:ATP-dependent DNA helicase RecG [Candidatus Peregrinibacteria bacterium RIFOXYB2_FULL_32_7]|nr:MAG: ATP-dependent DNA helicase RecG [Candidatus Peregrinibacteria bacterium RIFOXYB2_FULL_32_7]
MLQTLLSKVIRTTNQHIKQLKEMGILTVADLLLYFPRGYEDESDFRTIIELSLDEVNVVKGVISNISTRYVKNGMALTTALLTDKTGSIEATWFNQTYISKQLKGGDEIILTGKIKMNQGRAVFSSPKFEKVKDEQVQTGRIVPKYYQADIKDSKYKISSKWLREKIQPILYLADFFEEYLPENILDENDLLSFKEAVKQVHYPDSEESLGKARERLGFDELFILQFRALQKKRDWQMSWLTENRDKILISEKLLAKFLVKLPFKFTNAQTKALEAILADLKKPYPMLRLIQGDVGSGKTVVAAAGSLLAILSNENLKNYERPQVCVMVPTEVLAKQHYKTFSKLFNSFDIRVELLVGSFTQKQKKSIVENMKLGLTDIVIGTHALIQEHVDFKNLALAIVDEQHRFGVKQREYLAQFGHPHLLYLTATPIPRTLALTIYGDQDISVIDEMPPGRQEIITRIVPEHKRQDAYRWIEEQVKKGRQVFIICPLIDESDKLAFKAVTEEFKRLKEQFFSNLRLGLLHGRLLPQEKDQVMSEFSDGHIDILVSTSVIEVGIDVPNASIMLIEGAERFGLSQLHQFRGRVGRGEHQSYCFLFTDSDSVNNIKRLKAMVQHASGFKLSEIDLELRGPGEVYGVKQSGIPDLKMANLSDSKLIEKARSAAEKFIKIDPDLEKYPKLRKKFEEFGKEREGYFA